MAVKKTDMSSDPEVQKAKKKIVAEAKALDPDPSPARAKAVATKVVDDVIRTMNKKSHASEKKKISVLTRLGKLAKNSAYRGALKTAIVAKEVAFLAALSFAMAISGSAFKSSGARSWEAFLDMEKNNKTMGNKVKLGSVSFAYAAVQIMAAYAMYATLVMSLQSFARLITHMA